MRTENGHPDVAKSSLPEGSIAYFYPASYQYHPASKSICAAILQLLIWMGLILKPSGCCHVNEIGLQAD